MAAFVYMLRCEDGSLYTGWTTDLKRRLSKHQSGQGAKYTRARGAVKFVYQESLTDKSAALKREYELKRMSKEAKEALVRSFGSE